jgi:methylated-DNA-protein-cysteine methyltransferase-like protein
MPPLERKRPRRANRSAARSSALNSSGKKSGTTSGTKFGAKFATASETKPGKKKARHDKHDRVARCIRALPAGAVSTYGALARAAKWPGAARQVVRILRQTPGLPWHRVVGSGGAIKLSGENGAEQKFRLRLEGVTFRGARVDMRRHEYKFPR